MDEPIPAVDKGVVLTCPCPACGCWSRLLIEHAGSLMFEGGRCGHRFSKFLLGGVMERTGRELSEIAHGVRRN